MNYQVTVTDVAARPTAVVAATTTWQEFPALWKELLDEVWACLRAGGVHRGPYAGLATAHRAVLDWCATQGRRPAGPRWEVYGPHRDDLAELETEVCYLLS